MSASASPRIAWAVIVVYVAMALAALILTAMIATGPVDGAAPGSAVVGLAFAAVGAVLIARVPRHPIGWLFAAMALWGGAGELAAAYAGYGLFQAPGSLPAPEAAAWITGWGVSLYLGVFSLLVFPTGRPLSPRWRPLLWAAAVWLVLLVCGYALKPGPLWTMPEVENPLGVEGLAAVLDHVQAFESVGATLTMLLVVVSLVVRLRRSRGVEREQLKWLTYVVCVIGVLVLASGVGAAVGVAQTPRFEAAITAVFLVVLSGIPVAIGIAILRHRLYDIDVVIRRTLVYAALSATLAAGYLGCVLLAQLVIGAESGLAIAGSTLAMAALFRPARGRIQGAVDRRFYRRRYDAAMTLEAFGGRLREELDLDEVAADLRSVARRTVQPAHVSVWLRGER